MSGISERSIHVHAGISIPNSHLANSAVEARLHVVFTLVASVDETVLALVVELHQHTHGTPHGPPERTELQMLVPRQRQEGVAAVHQVAGHHGVGVGDGGQRVGSRPSDEPDDEEDLMSRQNRIQMSCLSVDQFLAVFNWIIEKIWF